MNTKPFAFQKKSALQIERFNGRSLLAMEPGLGKTLTSLLWGHWNDEMRPILVVCPASVKYQWQREAITHFNMRSQILESTRPWTINGLADICSILIINYDVLSYWKDYIKKVKPKYVILDECQYISNPKAKRSKVTKEICSGVPHVVALSGTPLMNRPSELWHILHILQPERYKRFFPFAMEYCKPRMTPWGWDFKGASNLKQLHKNLKSSVMIRVRKEEVLKDLPPKTRCIVPLELKNRKEYDHAINDFVGWLSRRSAVKADKARKAEELSKTSYLKQLIAQLKMPLVYEWIDDFLKNSNGKLLVFGIHREIVQGINKHYKDISVRIDGSVSPNERMRIRDQFQTDPRTRLFVGNIKAAGVGLNLNAANHVAFVEFGWTPGEHVQAEDRCHRLNTIGNVTCYYLIAVDTIEEKLVKLIQSKQRILDSVLDGRKIEDNLNIYSQFIKEIRKEFGKLPSNK